MTDNKPAPRCPYCGHKMGRYYAYDDFFFRCPKCRAASPDRDTEAEAYAAAMQRWQEPNRVLTMEELTEQRAVWVEDVSHGIGPAIVFDYVSDNYILIVVDFKELDYNEWFDNAEYGKHWRCWLRKPTQEEMEAVPWEKP